MSNLLTLPKLNNEVSNSLPGGRTRISCPPQIAKGVDKLEVSLSLNIENHEIFERFASLKEQVQQGLESSIAINFGSKEFFKWNLQRTGTKLYPYVFKSGDINLLLSSRKSESPISNCKIEIGSISSQDGAFKHYFKLLEWLKVYGLTVIKSNVSRIDLAVDFIGLSITELDVHHVDRWITRARKFSVYYEDKKLTGVMLGKGSFALRIYNKELELRQNQAKKEFFQNLWQVEKITEVTRVEIQIRREVLKEFDCPCTTPGQIETSLDSIWMYATENWARLCDSEVDSINNHQIRSKTSEFWKKVQQIVFRVKSFKTSRVKKNLHKNLVALREQARGCMINLAAAAGHDVDDFFGIIATCVDALSSDLADYMADEPVKFIKLFKQRRNEVYVGF